MAERRTFRDLIAANKRNSAILIVLMVALFLVLGGVLGGAFVASPGAVEEGVFSGTVIGGGSVVVNDIPEGVLAAGNPCRVIRKITPEDRDRYIRTPII